MASEKLTETLRGLQEDAPPALRPVLEAFLEESEDAPETAWQTVLKEILDEG